jgi:AraC-like DNA-binding protein
VGQFAKLDRHRLEGFEQLHEVVVGTHREIVQIERGKIQGELFHASVSDLPIDVATFNLGLRSRGGSVKGRIAVSMLLDSSQRVTRSSYESHHGDVLVMPSGVEYENTYYGGASVLVVSLSPDDIESSFGTETDFVDAAASGRRQFKASAETVVATIPRLRSFIERFGRKDLQLSAESAEFWKRAVLEAMMINVVNGVASERDGPLPSALKLVRRVDEFLDAQGTAAIHISRICGQLNVSRRTLHRAFYETLRIGPIAYLRHRRLCAVHTALRYGAAGETIADLAVRHGFLNVGRFAHYYRQLLGEYPHQTRSRANGLERRAA